MVDTNEALSIDQLLKKSFVNKTLVLKIKSFCFTKLKINFTIYLI